MRVAVSGSTGLVGTRLVRDLLADGHEVHRLERPDSPASSGGGTGSIAWDPTRQTVDVDALEGLDAIVHLAAAGIGDARWTQDRKRLIMRSRVDGTTLLATALAKLERPPAVLVSASAIGYYGDTGTRETDESGRPGHDFVAEVCRAWEAATAPAEAAGIRVVHLRSGVVQATEGGALAAQLPYFRLGLGGRSGSGRQYLSWISLHDEARAIAYLLDHELSGPVNLVAPEPTTNADYAATLGRVLRRPTTIIPMFGPRLLYGRELADSLLLVSQRIVPRKLLEAGFRFEHPQIEGALRDVLR